MDNKVVFNAERSNYYKAKKRELLRKKGERSVIIEDALFIKYYGMTAYLELFPEGKDFGINWHRQVLKELQRLERIDTAQMLIGIRLAYGSTKSKSMLRSFKRMIKDMYK